MGKFSLGFQRSIGTQYPTEEQYDKILRKGVSTNRWCVDIIVHKEGTGTGFQKGRIYIDADSLMSKTRACMALGEAVYETILKTKGTRGE